MKSLIKQCLIISMVGSLALSSILFLLLKRLTKPLDILAVTSKAYASGNYAQRILLTGNDEFTELSKYFNQMASEIEHQIVILREANIKKQLLIDNLAHEIRTPLTSIHGYAEYMQLTSLTEEERFEALTYITKESTRLSLLSKQLLLLADARNGNLLREKVDLEEILLTVLQSVRFISEEKQISILVNNHTNILYGDNVLLTSLIRNLLENAIRACSTHGEIEIEAITIEDQTVLSVMDNGKGMDQTEIVHITEPFYRIDKSRSRAEGGSGLGLALCKQIVESYEGTLEFISTKGKGTKVIVTFTTPLQVD